MQPIDAGWTFADLISFSHPVGEWGIVFFPGPYGSGGVDLLSSLGGLSDWEREWIDLGGEG